MGMCNDRNKEASSKLEAIKLITSLWETHDISSRTAMTEIKNVLEDKINGR